MRVLIIGGGQKGQNIANRLLAKDEYRLVFRSHEHQITFVEVDEGVCKELEARYGLPIFQGDGTKKEVLQQVGLNNIDVAIAAADNDGSNVIASASSPSSKTPTISLFWRRKASWRSAHLGPPRRWWRTSSTGPGWQSSSRSGRAWQVWSASLCPKMPRYQESRSGRSMCQPSAWSQR
ncbi:MAG: NAD-binding protein [Deltaproteobacteria bacterium]|nr:NAD-binding protein [Deltaproteobacteria bacterium]